MKELKNITIGTDAEVFFKEGNYITSAVGTIGGTKKNPIPIGNDCFAQEDNILAEFNIPPVTNVTDFVEYIEYCKDWLEITHPEFSLHYASSEKIERWLLLDSEARHFGCSPDCIVDYKSDRDHQTEDEMEECLISKGASMIRTSGFHIHIGYDNPDIETNREIVKLFEKYVTMPLILEDVDDYDRRTMYGKAGSYRNKEYGVECRSLGGYFLKNKTTIHDVWNRVQRVLKAFNSGERVSTAEFAEIKQIINTKDKTKIKELCAV